MSQHNICNAAKVKQWTDHLSGYMEAEDWGGLARELLLLSGENKSVFAFAVGATGLPKGLPKRLISIYLKFAKRCDKAALRAYPKP